MLLLFYVFFSCLVCFLSGFSRFVVHLYIEQVYVVFAFLEASIHLV